MRASLRRAVLAAIVTACVFSGAAGAYATDVKIASFRSFVFFPVWVAKEGGFFERESLNAELLFFSSGTEMTSALLSQSVDFASTMADRPMLLKDRGQETRHLIALTTQAPYTLVVPLGAHRLPDEPRTMSVKYRHTSSLVFPDNSLITQIELFCRFCINMLINL